MSKKQKQTTSTDVDPRTQRMRGQVYDAATAAANSGAPGLNPMLSGAQGFLTNGVGQGNLGLNALSGDAGAAGQLMNPYQTQVIDALNNQWDKINRQTTAGLNSQATQAGAFGGSRHGVAQGVALANNAQAQNSQIAGLLQGGFENAMGRAGQLANFGLGSTSQIPGFNEYSRGFTDPNLYRMRTLQSGMQGMPFGQTQTTTQNKNMLSGAAGGVLGAAMAGINPAFGLLGAL